VGGAALLLHVPDEDRPHDRRRAKSAYMRQSIPDSGLGLSHCSGKGLQNHSTCIQIFLSCSLVAGGVLVGRTTSRRVGSNSLCSLPRYVPHVAGFRRGPAQSKKLKKAIWSCSGGRRVCAAAPVPRSRTKLSVSIASMCTTSRRIAASASTKQEPYKGVLVLLRRATGGRRCTTRPCPERLSYGN